MTSAPDTISAAPDAANAAASGIDAVPFGLAISDPKAFSDRLGSSFQRYGFAIIDDHPVDQTVIEAALDAAKAFFALPEETKRKYHIPGGGGARGFTPFGTEAAKGAKLVDLKEFWHVGRDLPPNHAYRDIMADNLDVAEVERFHARVYALFEALDAMGGHVLQALAVYLGLDEDFFAPTVDYGNSVLRLLHYPPVQAGAQGIRAEAHGDINTITLLLGAEEAGLQALTRSGEWLSVNPKPGSLVVNVGDMLQRLTNDFLPSTTHRVINPTPDRAHAARYSTPFFLHFNPDYVIDPLPSCVTADNPKHYEPITAQGFLEERLKEIRLK